MSQQQTVRITTTETTNSSALVINSGYITTPPGLLKVAQFVNIFWFLYVLEIQNNCYHNETINYIEIRRYEKILGCICVGIIAYHFNDRRISTASELFFYLMCVTFLICTTILLLSCLISWSTGGIISKTIYVSNPHINTKTHTHML